MRQRTFTLLQFLRAVFLQSLCAGFFRARAVCSFQTRAIGRLSESSLQTAENHDLGSRATVRESRPSVYFLITIFICLTPGCAQNKNKKQIYDPLCQTHPQSQNSRFANSDLFNRQRIRRLAIAAEPCNANSELQQPQFITHLSSEIEKVAGVAAPMMDEIHGNVENVNQVGRFDERDLIKGHQHYNADAVLYSTITDYQPYWPMRAKVSIAIIDTNEAIVVAEINGNWNLAVPQTAKQFAEFVRFRYTNVENSSIEALTESPSVFQRFVAHEIAQCVNSMLSTKSY